MAETNNKIYDSDNIAGIRFDKRKNKWIAKISPKRKQIILGEFDNKEDAIKTRLDAEIKYWGEYRPIKRQKRKKLSYQEAQDWEDLYSFVRNLMGYDENQSLSKTMVIRLKGLLTGKFMENHNIVDGSHYSYEVVLNTFKSCSTEIQYRLRVTNFKNEKHKFNYILRIVEDNLNNIYLRMKNVEKSKSEIEHIKHIDIVPMTNVSPDKEKVKRKDIKNKYSDLW